MPPRAAVPARPQPPGCAAPTIASGHRRGRGRGGGGLQEVVVVVMVCGVGQAGPGEVEMPVAKAVGVVGKARGKVVGKAW
mgnify:CR=1 FL=1